MDRGRNPNTMQALLWGLALFLNISMSNPAFAEKKGVCPHLLLPSASSKLYPPSFSTNFEFLAGEAVFNKEDFPQKNLRKIEAKEEYLFDEQSREQLLLK